MNITQKIHEANEKQIQLENETKQLGSDFTSFIKDKNIPLKERWKVFAEAPDYLSDELDSFPEFHYENLGEGLTFFMDKLLVEEHIKQLESGSNTLNIKSIISNYYDEKNNTMSAELARYSLEDKYDPITNKELEEKLWQLMEDVLQLNLVSFDFDS